MIRLTDIHPISEMQRNPKALLQHLRDSKSPAVLTVNGKAEFVVQDVESYQALLDQVKAAQDIEAIREGLDDSLSGKVRLASSFFNEFESR